MCYIFCSVNQTCIMDAAHQDSISFTVFQSLLKFILIESVMASNDLILCCPLLLLPSIFPLSGCFAMNQLFALGGQWSFRFSISPSNEYSGLISFRIDWFDLLSVQGTLKSLLQHHSSKASILQHLAFFMDQLSHPLNDYWEDHSFDYADICGQNDVFTF